MREERRSRVVRTVAAGIGACAVTMGWLGCGGTDFTGALTDDAGADAGGVPDATARDGGPGSDAGTADGGGSRDGGGDARQGSDAGGDASHGDAGLDSSAGDAGGDSAANDSGGDSAASDAGGDAGADAPACGPPTGNVVYVSPSGSDTAGTGSQACPFVTITKALSLTVAASSATTIMVASGSAGSPFVYGAGCTAGAGKCDTTPIRVTDGMSHGILITGSSATATATEVIGGVAQTDTAVFLVSPPNVSFANLLISPRRVATVAGSGRVAGAAGIAFAGPPVSSGSEGSVTNVVIEGIAFSVQTESTGSGISLSGGTSPTIGPGVTINGGDHGVLVTQAANGSPPSASKPVITSSAQAPTLIRFTQFACVRVESTNGGAASVPTATLTATSAADPGRLHLQDCGGGGGIVVDTVKAGTAVGVTSTLIDTTANGVSTIYGIRLQHFGVLTAGVGVTVTGINESSVGVGAGIEVIDNGRLTIAPPSGLASGSVVLSKNTATGLHIGGNGIANVDGLSAVANRNGILCDASAGGAVAATNLTLRNSSLLANRTFGASIVGGNGGASCVADLGSVAGQGNNVFNRTSQQNTLVGLCYTASTPAFATASTWGCGLAANAACTPATATTPTPIAVANCTQVGDYNTSASLTVALPQTCCGL